MNMKDEEPSGSVKEAFLEKQAAFFAGQESRNDEVSRLLAALREIEQKAWGSAAGSPARRLPAI
jgi:hypothetical protein